MFTIAGCSKSTNNESQNKKIDSTINESKDDIEIKYADLIPDPEVIFPNGSIYVTDSDGGKAYIFEVSDINDGEFEAYISKCKEFGFDDISYEMSHEKGKDFGAYSSDGLYWVQVNLDTEKNIVYIICQAAKKTPEAKKTKESSGVSGDRNISGFDSKTNQKITWGGIEFSFPSYFDVLDEGSTDTSISYYPKEEDYYASLLFQMVEFTGTQEDFNNLIPSILDNTFNGDDSANTEILVSEEITIAGLPGWTTTYSKSDKEVVGVTSTGTYSFIYNVNTEKIVMITCFYDSDDQSQFDYLGDYKKVLETANLDAEPLDLNAINKTNSVESDSKFVEKYYSVIGIIDQAIEPSDGMRAMVIIEPDVLAKGMNLAYPLEINIWLTEDEFEKIGGGSSVGKEVNLSVKLTSISRNIISNDPEVKGYPIQLEFGEPNWKVANNNV